MQFLGTFCCVSVITAALSLLIPEGKMSKTVSYAICLLFICVVFSAGRIALGFSGEKNALKTNIKYELSSAETAKAVFEQALKNENIKYSNIEVLTSINAYGGIDIKEVTVISSADSEIIKKTLGDGADYKVSVIGE